MISRWKQRRKYPSSPPDGSAPSGDAAAIHPTTQPSPPLPKIPRRHPHAPSSMESPCNSFLLGGNFYAGKKHAGRRGPFSSSYRAQQRRSRALWRRIFCSSPARGGASALLAALVFLRYVAAPLAGLAWNYGIFFSGGEYGEGRTKRRHGSAGAKGEPPPRLNHADDTELRSELFRSIGAMRENEEKLDGRRDALRRGGTESGGRRWDAVRKLAPGFAARKNRGVRGEAETTMADTGMKHGAKKEGGEGGARRAKEERRPASAKGGNGAAENAGASIISDAARREKAVAEGRKGVKEKTAMTAGAVKAGVGAAAEVEAKKGDAGGASPSYRRHRDALLRQIELQLNNSSPPPLRTFATEVDDPAAHPNACPASGFPSPSSLSATLVVQCTVDRVWLLHETCLRWSPDPVVLMVYLPYVDAGRASQQEDAIVRPVAELMDEFAKHPYRRHLLTVLIHVGEDPNKMSDVGGDAASLYPVNALRNLGLDAVSTSHALVLDVDLIPSEDLSAVIRENLMDRAAEVKAVSVRQWKKNEKTEAAAVQRRQRYRHGQMGKSKKETKGGTEMPHEAIVVPAFERKVDPPCTDTASCQRYLREDPEFVPRLFVDLKKCVAEGKCISFQEDVNWEGHSTTRSKAWLDEDWYRDYADDDGEGGSEEKESNDSSEEGGEGKGKRKDGNDGNDDGEEEGTNSLQTMRRIECFDSLRYEPYVVVPWCPTSPLSSGDSRQLRRSLTPYYDERFHGYGKNKIQHVSHLRFLGVPYYVLPRGFAVHHPHPESSVKKVWNDRDGNKLHQRMDTLYREYIYELVEKYGDGGGGSVEDRKRRGKIVPECSRSRSGGGGGDRKKEKKKEKHTK